MSADSLNSYVISEAEFQEFFSANQAWVELCLSDGKHDSWIPTLKVLARNFDDGEREVLLYVFDVDFNNDEVKRRSLFTAGRDCYEQRKIPLSIALSSETWIARDPGDRSPAWRPADSPERREAVTVFALTIDQRTAAASCSIERVGRRMRAGKFETVEGKINTPLLLHFYRGFFDRTLTLQAERQ